MMRSVFSSLRQPVFATAFLLVLFFVFLSASVRGETGEAGQYQKAVQASKAQDWETAAAGFQRVVQLNPKHVLAYANLGVVLSHLNRHKEALFSFEKALQLGYDGALFRYNRGLSFARVNLVDEAVTEIETALKMDPRMPRAVYDLGFLYILQGRNEDAFKLVDRLYPRNHKLAEKLFKQIPPVYQVVTTPDSGTLKGRVNLTGPVPKPRFFHLIHAPNIEFCSRISDGHGHRLLYDFTVSESGGLKDTVIKILGVKKGKPYPPRMKSISIARCHPDKYVIGVKNGESLVIENTDPIQHEIVTYEVREPHFRQKSNKALVARTTQIRSAFVRSDTEEFLVKCNLHPFLQTRGVMVDNPYYTISDSEGRFTIEDIPPGTYEVEAWHPFIPTQKGTITIREGEEAELNFTFNGNHARRKLYHDDVKGYRFQPWYDSFEKFYGGPRIDDPVEILQGF